jgi:hypothetical protein
MLYYTSALLVACTLVGQAAPPPPENHDRLHEIMGKMIGEWKSDDFPEPGGSCVISFQWAAQQQIVHSKSVVRDTKGNAVWSGRANYYWDPAEKKAKFLQTDSWGGVIRGTVESFDESSSKWTSKQSEGNRQAEGEWKFTMPSDNELTFFSSETVWDDGQTEPAITINLKRRLPPNDPLPDDVRKSFERMVGEWIGEWEVGEMTGRNHEVVEWGPDKHCLIRTQRLKSENLESSAVTLVGWDPTAQQVCGTHYSVVGVVVYNRWTLKSPTSREGTAEWHSADGSRSEAKISLEIEGPDNYTFTCFDRKAADGSELPNLVIKYRRVRGE